MKSPFPVPTSIVGLAGLLVALAAPALAQNPAPVLPAASPAEQGQAIAKKIAERSSGYGDMVGEVEMTLRNKGGDEATRRFTLKLLERPAADEGDYSLVVFQSPADVKGTALLSHVKINDDDDQWLYLPALKRVKRISSQSRTGSFVGSEFSYEDLSGNEVAEHEWKLDGEGPCRDGKTCYKLEARPKDPASGYQKRVLFVEKDGSRIQKVVFYDRRGDKLKALKYDDYKKVGGRFDRAHRWHMKNYQTGKETLLTFRSLVVNKGLTESDFNKAQLKGG
ncbi:MAG: outer membrane lipoprotein-sorting protein [Myxococcales bacterium]|nr:outer membrane lipoprotein-sorting protein [Myxococcales bacterium]